MWTNGPFRNKIQDRLGSCFTVPGSPAFRKRETIDNSRGEGGRLVGILVRSLGAALLALGLLPIYRALDTSGDAPFRQASVEIAETTLQLAWWGSLFVLLVAVLLAFLFRDLLTNFGRVIGRWLSRPRLPVFAAFAGLLAFGLALAVGHFLYQGLYTNMDEIASAIQARYMAAGRLSGPDLPFPEAWIVTNTLIVARGWVSQYPPSHLAIMALFFRLGIPRLIGPVLMGLMTWLLALSFPRLLPRHLGAGRAAVILIAFSPFILFLAAGSLSHLTAGAASAGILYASLRARDGKGSWALVVGASVGVMVCARPLVGLVLGTALPVTIWGPPLLAGRARWAFRRALATVAGGLPFAILLGLYNRFLFGAATRFGYLAAFGSNHKLGFHLDPWGYWYGIESALAFDSIDLLAMGVQILETPLPLTVVIGGYLLLGPKLPRGSGTVMAWALLPLLANTFYWFHDPRMMFEAAPAWILLATLGTVEIVSWSEGRGPWSARLGQVTSFAVAVSLVAAIGWDIPTRWRNYAWTAETLSRIRVPELPTKEPALVFVHTSWNERLSSRLQGAGGMRQDSIVSALRRNTNCRLQQFADLREAQARGGGSVAPVPDVDLEQSGDPPEGLILVSLVQGMSIRTEEGETLTPECVREIESDRFGAVALAPLLWQGDLPGDLHGDPLFVRDLGPETNGKIRSLFPDRPAFVFTPFAPGAPPRIAAYEDAMRILWSEEP